MANDKPFGLRMNSGNLMLSVMARSLNHYYLFTSQNKVQPENFIGNRVAGILFENKLDHTTYFGANIEYIQGIHMLPLLPSSRFTRKDEFVKQEWETYFDKGRADKIEGGWKGILYGNLATVDPTTAWSFFTNRDFDPSWLDGGVSLTWYQVFAAGKFRIRVVCLYSSTRLSKSLFADCHDGKAFMS